MATDYWASTHHKKWVVDRLTVYKSRLEDLKYATPEQLAFLNIYFANLIGKLGKKLVFRQRVMATATVFFKRFYLKNSYCDTDPYLVVVACCYVAGKAEELPSHIKNVISVANQVLKDIGVWHLILDNHKLAEMEFYLVDELECDLIVFHPYRTMITLCGKEDPSSPDEEAGEAGVGAETVDGHTGGKLLLDERTFQLAWLIINDTYRTDVCLLYPPFMIAIAAIYLSLVNHDRVRTPASSQAESQKGGSGTRSTRLSSSSQQQLVSGQRDPITFLANLNVSMATIVTISQEMLSYYTLSPRYLDDTGKDSTKRAAADLEAMVTGTSSQGDESIGEKVHAKQLGELINRMREKRDAEVAANGWHHGKPVNKRLERAQAAG